MAEKISGAKTEIKHRGTFSYDTLISTVRKFLKGRYYGYTEKKLKYTPDNRELDIEGDKKINEYAKHIISVSINVLNRKEVEVIKDGHKRLMDEGRVIITVSAEMEIGWQKRFEDKDLWKTVKSAMQKYTIKHRIAQWGDELDSDVVDLTKDIKKALETEI
jgi:hypothetical protein